MKIPEKHRAVAHAFVDGADVQHRAPEGYADRVWYPAPRPGWFEDWEYRVAPKKVKKWKWIYRSKIEVDWASMTLERYADEKDFLSDYGDQYYLAIKLDWTEREVEIG